MLVEFRIKSDLFYMDGPQQWKRRMADATGRHEDSTTGKPAIGFHYGMAVILFLVLGVSALFSCCYHWEKIRNMHHRRHYRSSGEGNTSSRRPGRSSFTAPAIAQPNCSNPCKNAPVQQSPRSLPVMMPGDNVPKFLAMPSPHGFAPENVGDNAVASSHMNQSKRIPQSPLI